MLDQVLRKRDSTVRGSRVAAAGGKEQGAGGNEQGAGDPGCRPGSSSRLPELASFSYEGIDDERQAQQRQTDRH